MRIYNNFWFKLLEIKFINISNLLSIDINNVFYDINYEILNDTIDNKLNLWVEKNKLFLTNNGLFVRQENDILIFYSYDNYLETYNINSGLYGFYKDFSTCLVIEN